MRETISNSLLEVVRERGEEQLKSVACEPSLARAGRGTTFSAGGPRIAQTRRPPALSDRFVQGTGPRAWVQAHGSGAEAVR